MHNSLYNFICKNVLESLFQNIGKKKPKHEN